MISRAMNILPIFSELSRMSCQPNVPCELDDSVPFMLMAVKAMTFYII